MIELGPLAVDIARAIVAGFPGERLQAAIERLAAADAVIASTPVYKAGISGLFKSFVDVLDNDLLIAKPVILAATAGTPRHAMVVDEQLRPLFAFLRALPVPTSLFAAPEDWGSPTLGDRIDRAATELALLLRSGVGRAIADDAWSGYQHQFAGNATRAERSGSRRRLRHRSDAARCRWRPSSSVSSDPAIGPGHADMEDGNGPPPDGGGPFPGSSRGGTITPSVRNERGAFAPQAVGVRNQSRSFACSASLLPPCSGRSAFAFSPAV